MAMAGALGKRSYSHCSGLRPLSLYPINRSHEYTVCLRVPSNSAVPPMMAAMRPGLRIFTPDATHCRPEGHTVIQEKVVMLVVGGIQREKGGGRREE